MAEIKQIVRLIDVDILGNKPIYYAINQVRGMGFSMVNSICNLLKLDKNKKVGECTDEELAKIEAAIRNPPVPAWMMNRRKDLDTGKDIHLLSSDLKFATDFDIKRMRKIKCYKGVRHSLGQPVRGQRTKSHFRRGRAVGVSKGKGGKKGK